ncbi:PKD domain-containing protein [Pontibacter diazotrophicus]|uniref:PKD domain-containing protein n=1 Tax=Pontibacter diazotrophicus TaxID=1400979 RepID=A0A3D8KYZ0_9BACT|nr:PKD domain-containing protein [Pontibacter diazotrophicus]RDV10390.1 PKD domain-containing protein [Pontibacter diazotrophicus]
MSKIFTQNLLPAGMAGKEVMEVLSFYQKKRFIKAIGLFFMLTAFMVPLNASSQQSYQANASASQVADAIDEFILTPDLAQQVGSVWNKTPIRLDRSFDFEFKVYLGSKDSNGADGIAFVLQPLGTTVTGGSGGALGYGYIKPSMAVEYDTYLNLPYDPAKDHLSIHKNGDTGTPLITAVVANSTGNIEDSKWHTTRIVWNARTQNLTVYFDGVQKLSYTDNIVTNIFSDSPEVFWGFTGGTGGSSNLQMFSVVKLDFASGMTLNAVSTNQTCPDFSDGSITLAPTGGTAPYEYSIDGGMTYQPDNVFRGVSEGKYTAIVRDYNRFTSSTSVNVLQHNDLPIITSLTGGGTDPVSLSSASVSFSAQVTDDNLATASWDWGDGSTSPGTIEGTAITGSHTYLEPGVNRVTLTVTDACGEADVEVFEYVVVYDPNGGFVTGGGWIDSPAGAYTADPSAFGKANFGFVSKYQKGATIPSGQTQFQFHAAGFNFHSTSYEWLVVSGHKAQYKGEGNVNGNSGYAFMLSAVDGAYNSSNPVDRFRIKVWLKSNGQVVYDNQMGSSEDAEATTALDKGSIVIHDSKFTSTSTSSLTAAPAQNSDFLEEQFFSYPTVFSDINTVAFALDKIERFTLEVYDLKGALVQKVTSGLAEAGKLYHFEVNGERLPEGIYIARLATDSQLKSLKIIRKNR